MTDWVYPDYFKTMTTTANWVATASVIFTVFLLLSWAVLPVDKTGRHYLSVCLTAAVLLMNVSTTAPCSIIIAKSRLLTGEPLARLRHSARGSA